MTLFGLLGLILGVTVLGVLIYWQLIIAEGAYLGTWVVTLLYDWSASRYNAIKEFNDFDEDVSLGWPLTTRLLDQPESTIVDIATGTGRLAHVMARQKAFQGKIIGVDRSARMLAIAQKDAVDFKARFSLVQADAMALPFADSSAPVVTCLEALEFLPNPDIGLAELVRVLQPADISDRSRGWLLTTNRIGWEARLLPGKTWTREQLRVRLKQLQLTQINIHIWQDIYDLAWGQKVVTEVTSSEEAAQK
jgi:ubiquinone/menaquinone biosynthesis C-methylase UbiE